MASEAGQQPNGGDGGELPTAWKSKVRQMLLEGLSSDAMADNALHRKQSFHSGDGDGGTGESAKGLFAELDKEKHHFERQYHRYLDRAPRAKVVFDVDTDVDAKSVDTEDDVEQDYVYEEGLKLLRRLSKETSDGARITLGAEEVGLLCELFEKKTAPRVSSQLTSEYIDLLPEQLYDSHIKDFLIREFSVSSNKFTRRFRQKSEASSLSRTSSNFSVTSPLPSPVDLRKTFSLTKTLLHGKGMENGEISPGLRSYRSYTEVLNRKSKTNGNAVGSSRLHRTVSTRSNTAEKKKGVSGEDDSVNDESIPQTTLEVDLALTERLYQMLLKIDEWSFNIHEIESVAPKGAMVSIGFGLFERHRLLEAFSIAEDTMLRFLSKLQDAYRKNPYHNWMHASDCAQTMSHLILRCGFSLFTSDLLRFALIFSALAHDVRHPGVTNSYLIKIGHPLAIRYNDKSPLEMMHASTVFEIVRKPKYNVLARLDPEQYQDFRHATIALILATDNAEHNLLMSKIEKLATNLQSSESVPLSDGDNLAIMSAALHAADISASAKPWKIYNEWTKRLTVEFRLQGDLERKRGMDVLPFMDRNSGEPIARLQAGFIMAISMPLYKQLDAISGVTLAHALSYIDQNLETWKQYATRKQESGKRASDVVLKKLTVDKAKRHFIKHHERSQERARKASAEMSALRGTKPI